MVDVSVLTPSYGYGRFIGDAILSVLGQDGVTVEHIIQDALSPDNTVDVLREFADVIDWRSEADEGQSDALNKALGRAQGRWIAWLNADEFYLPGALATLVERGDLSGADVVCGDTVFVDEAGKVIRLSPQHRFSRTILHQYGCFIATASTIMRRSVLETTPWDTEIRRIMDWDLFMNLSAKGVTFKHVAHPVGSFRVHDERVTARPWTEFAKEDTSVYERHGLFGTPEDRWRAAKMGRALHKIYKAANGGHLRELQALSLAGEDLRWFRKDAANKTYRLLLRRCYPGRRHTPNTRD